MIEEKNIKRFSKFCKGFKGKITISNLRKNY
jgi:hypothetical protein